VCSKSGLEHLREIVLQSVTLVYYNNNRVTRNDRCNDDRRRRTSLSSCRRDGAVVRWRRRAHMYNDNIISDESGKLRSSGGRCRTRFSILYNTLQLYYDTVKVFPSAMRATTASAADDTVQRREGRAAVFGAVACSEITNRYYYCWCDIPSSVFDVHTKC